jgi:hypothetical protein
MGWDLVCRRGVCRPRRESSAWVTEALGGGADATIWREQLAIMLIPECDCLRVQRVRRRGLTVAKAPRRAFSCGVSEVTIYSFPCSNQP